MSTITITPEQQALAESILAGTNLEAGRVAEASTADDSLIDVQALIQAALARATAKPVEKPGQVEVTDPDAISTLLALADEHERQAKFHTEQREAIKDALKGIIEHAEETSGETIDSLTIHGARVFSYKRSESRVLNQKAVKQLFPDIPENAELYATQTSRRATFA